MSNEGMDLTSLINNTRNRLRNLVIRSDDGEYVNYYDAITDLVGEIDHILSLNNTNGNADVRRPVSENVPNDNTSNHRTSADMNIDRQSETTIKILLRYIYGSTLSNISALSKLFIGLMQKMLDNTTWIITCYILCMIFVVIIYFFSDKLHNESYLKKFMKAVILSMMPISDSIFKIIFYYIFKNNDDYSINLEIEWIEISLMICSFLFYLVCVVTIKYIFYR